MKTVKYATLFGGAGKDTKSKEYLETVKIGQVLAELGFTVKNGGYEGMMEAVSKGVTQNSGSAVGITCKQVGSSKGNEFLTKTIVTDTLFERLQLLIEGTKLFIVQRGGIGTLSEVFLTLDILRKERKSQPTNVFFVGEIWQSTLTEMKKYFIPQYEHHLFQIVKCHRELREMIEKLHH